VDEPVGTRIIMAPELAPHGTGQGGNGQYDPAALSKKTESVLNQTRCGSTSRIDSVLQTAAFSLSATSPPEKEVATLGCLGQPWHRTPARLVALAPESRRQDCSEIGRFAVPTC
jgi:hypothetical protein